MVKRFVIIHYNTPLLTDCLVRSINLFVKNAIIYIFDNSDKYPFASFYNNVLVLDNTKGQIINFDNMLSKYPNKEKSHGRVNNWGSAKHAYSVEKCMDLIGENFILLDSDILLKRDVSNLFIEDCIYCGETVTQPKSSIQRILPFVCFINTKMCIEKKVHYFDERFMHGLYYSPEGDKYDTGGAFFLNTRNYKYTEINLSEYMIHYGHGSWEKKGEIPKLTPVQWLKKNKKYWTKEMNKKVIYTCITGGYDSLIEPEFLTSDFDYICFTDNTKLKSNVWDIRPLPKETNGLTTVKKQRYVKLNPHKLLQEYELSIWVDGNVEIKGDLNELINSTIKNECSVYVPRHPARECLYDEAVAIKTMRKDTKANVDPQIERYRKDGFPVKNGLLQSNILIRKHNEKDCIKLMESWFEEVKNGSHRDQLSFNYVSWKNSDVKVIYLHKKIYDSKWFKWRCKHANSASALDRIRERVKDRNQNENAKESKRIRIKSTDILTLY